MRAGYSLIVVVIVCAVFHTAPVYAACGNPQDRPSIGLVLSGGGARGAAHVGAIRVLEELKVPIDCVAGTSMGAIVGGLYATGLNAAELEKTMLGVDWIDGLKDSPSRRDLSFRRKQDDTGFLIDFDLGFRGGKVRLPKGLVQGQKFSSGLRNVLMPVQGVEQFDDLPIPFRAVATDVENGNMIVLGRGDLVSAIKASMSAPGVFAPVEMNGKLLVDGGIANNLPVDVARAMGADIVIVVDIGFPLLPKEKLGSAFSLTNQMLTILIRRKSIQQLQTLTSRDIAILPELGDIGSTDFHRLHETIPRGVKAAEVQSKALSKLAIPEAQYLAYQAKKVAQRTFGARVVRNIIIKDDSNWSDKVLRGSLMLHEGKNLDIDTLQSDIARLYGLNSFELVEYNIENIGDHEADITITMHKKSWGPNFVNFGINLLDDFEGASGYNLGIRYTQTQVNPLGAEWRTDFQVGDTPFLLTEFYQPLNYASRYFVAPQILLQKQTVNQFGPSGSLLSEFRLSSSRAFLEFGRTFGQNSEVRVGVSRGKSRATVRIGDPNSEKLEFENGAWRFAYSYDSRDNVRFPRNGIQSRIQWDGFRESLGDERDSDRLTFDWLSAHSFGNNTLLASAIAGSNLDSDGQIDNQFDAGGLFRLSGFRNGQLRGQHVFVSGLTYFRRIALGSKTFETPLYLGGSIEAGNVWKRSDDIRFSSLLAGGSVFIGLDTFIGPVYLAYGLAQGGNTAAYFALGQAFGFGTQ